MKHYIIMSSSYRQGTRIALDITDDSFFHSELIDQMISYIKIQCGWEAPLSTHFIETDSETWKSVEEYDPFFKGVKPYDDVKKFAEALKKDKELNGLDVAKYILARVQGCTHLKLQKLTYLCYADFLCKSGRKLFEDEIYAFDYGPVVKSVYDTFRGSRYIQEPQSHISAKVSEMSSRSRIMFSDDGINKLRSIEDTINRYGGLSSTQIVSLTHQKDTPWSKTNTGEAYKKIEDSTIRQYHNNEMI